MRCGGTQRGHHCLGLFLPQTGKQGFQAHLGLMSGPLNCCSSGMPGLMSPLRTSPASPRGVYPQSGVGVAAGGVGRSAVERRGRLWGWSAWADEWPSARRLSAFQLQSERSVDAV